MLTTSIFFCYTLLIHELPCRVPRDITSASPAKNVETKGEPPKVDKPLSPSAGKIIPEMPNHSSMKTTNELIDVSFYAPFYLLTLRPDSLLI
jgi:hypothetical protein